MTSGIYKLTFSDGSFYIGKSNDIERRWDQHYRSLIKGTHAKLVQDAYDRLGEPRFSILIKCHEDHIDILEGMCIWNEWGPKILNGSQPKPPDQDVLDAWNSAPIEFWQISTPQHYKQWLSAVQESDTTINKLKANIEKLKRGTRIQELEDKYKELSSLYFSTKHELDTIKRKGFFERLFNL